jgi:hypothetical protein
MFLQNEKKEKEDLGERQVLVETAISSIPLRVVSLSPAQT